MQIRSVALTIALTLALSWLGGCCCCCGEYGNWLNVDENAFDEDSSDGSISSSDPKLSKELQQAHKYAQRALSVKGYGTVKSADLRKDGLTWYVSGAADGKDGTDISYEVTFQVTHSDSADQIIQNWVVQTVTVNGEVVYP